MKKPVVNLIYNTEMLNAVHISLGTKQIGLVSLLLFSIVLVVLGSVVRQEKEIEDIMIGKKDVKTS